VPSEVENIRNSEFSDLRRGEDGLLPESHKIMMIVAVRGLLLFRQKNTLFEVVN